LDLRVPVLVIVEKLRVQIVTEQRAAGGPDMARFIGLDGEDVAALFVTVQGFHIFIFIDGCCPSLYAHILAVHTYDETLSIYGNEFHAEIQAID